MFYHSDKTYSEILDAIVNNQQYVVAMIGDTSLIPLTYIEENSILFSMTLIANPTDISLLIENRQPDIIQMNITIDSDNHSNVIIHGYSAAESDISQLLNRNNPLSIGEAIAELYNNKSDKAYVNTQISSAIADLVDTAPDTLNTLGELATAIQENDSVIDTLDAAITNKADKTEVEALKTQVTSTSLFLADAITGQLYKIQIQNGQLVSFPVED